MVLQTHSSLDSMSKISQDVCNTLSLLSKVQQKLVRKKSCKDVPPSLLQIPEVTTLVVFSAFTEAKEASTSVMEELLKLTFSFY